MLRTKTLSVFLLLVLFTASIPAEAARRRAASHPGTPLSELFSQGGYASRTSVVQGGMITFHIASSAQPLTIDVVHLADRDRALMSIANVTSQAQLCAGAAGSDCPWAATTTISIPETWPSGYYAARFPTSLGDRWAPFVVVSSRPGTASPTLVVSSTHTMQAYNRFGSAGNSERVSYRRPYAQNDGLGAFADQEGKLADWLTAEGLPFEVATDVDLEDPELLSHYNLILFAGRSEFWTANARHHLEAFTLDGGHVAVFNGNTSLRSVRLEDERETIVGASVSEIGSTGSRVPQLMSTRWFEAPDSDPETRLFGTSLRYGGLTNVDENAPRTGWTVTGGSHWLYTGTNLSTGSTFGAETVGPEVSGTLFNCGSDGGMIGVDSAAGTPLNYQILAWTPASEGTGTLGLYTNPSGGLVFNAGTERWTDGLQDDITVRRITRNLIDQLSTGEPVPYQQRVTMLLTEERFNCRQYTMYDLPGWTQSPAKAATSQRCAYEGAAGVEFSGAQGIEIVRDFTPTAQNHQEIGARFYIKLDPYIGKPDGLLARVALRNSAQQYSQEPLVVEFSNVNGKIQSRIVRRDSAGNVFAGDWLEMNTPGWHLIWLTWRSPGEIVLQLDKIPTRTLDNPDTTQFVGEITFEYPQPAFPDDGHVCVDALALGTVKPGSLPPNP